MKLKLPKLGNKYLHVDEIPNEVHKTRFKFVGAMLPVLACGDGLLIVAGGPNRWVGGSLEAMMTAFPGATVVFGGILFILGVNLAVALYADNPFMNWFAAWGCGFWYFIAVWFSLAQLAMTPNDVGNIGWLHYLIFAVLFIVHAESRVDRR